MDPFTVSSIMRVMGEIPKKASILISDEKRFIYYEPSKHVDLKIKPGDTIKPNSLTYKAMAVRKKVAEKKDSDVFGVPYFGVSVPILDSDSARGCVTAIMPREPLQFATPFLTVRTTDRWLPIDFKDIIYMEAQNRKTLVKSTHAAGHHKYNLSELEFFLPDDTFIRCHRSYIINIHHVAEIHPDSHSTFLLIMKDGSKIPVSQTYASQFRKTLCF